jgi:hypothetical protein
MKKRLLGLGLLIAGQSVMAQINHPLAPCRTPNQTCTLVTPGSHPNQKQAITGQCKTHHGKLVCVQAGESCILKPAGSSKRISSAIGVYQWVRNNLECHIAPQTATRTSPSAHNPSAQALPASSSPCKAGTPCALNTCSDQTHPLPCITYGICTSDGQCQPSPNPPPPALAEPSEF